MTIPGISKCEKCGKFLILNPGTCPACGMPVVDRSGSGSDVALEMAPALRKIFYKYRNAGYVIVKRTENEVIMSHRNLKSGSISISRYLEYAGYLAVAMGTFYLFDSDIINGVLALIFGAAVLYNDYRKKKVRITLNDSGAVVEKGNILGI